MNHLRRLALFFVIAMLASACIKVDMRIDVADDGSAEVSGIVAMNASTIADLAEDFGDESIGDRDSLCSEFNAEQTSNTDSLETKPYSDGDFCGVEFSGQLSPDEVEQEMGTLAGSDDFIIEERDGGWYFEMQLSEDTLGTGDLDGAEDFFDLDDVFGGAEYIIRVRLPGKQVDHNGVIDQDGAVVWDLDLLNPPERIFLQTEPGERETGGGIASGSDDDGGSNTAVIIIVVLALLALAAAAYFLLRKKGDDNGDQAAPPFSAPGADGLAGVGAAQAAAPVGDFAAPPPGGAAGGPLGAANQAGAPAPTQPQPVVPQPTPAPPEPQATPAPTTADTPSTGSPTKEEATGAPAWDPVRGQYVQWDPAANNWLVHDQASGEWKVE